jgi:hypothetical protein
MSRAMIVKIIPTCAFLLILSTVVNGQAKTTTTTTTASFTSVISTACAGELIDVTGHLHRVQHSTANGQGLVSTVTHLNVSGIGVGQVTGEHYVFTQTSTDAFNTRAGAPLESTITETIHVISAAGNDDFRLRAVFHTTINENGETTAVVESMARVCD